MNDNEKLSTYIVYWQVNNWRKIQKRKLYPYCYVIYLLFYVCFARVNVEKVLEMVVGLCLRSICADQKTPPISSTGAKGKISSNTAVSVAICIFLSLHFCIHTSNAITEDLTLKLWNSFPNSVLVISYVYRIWS